MHKISNQLFLFGIIRIRLRCHCHNFNLTPKFSLAFKKCEHTSQWFLHIWSAHITLMYYIFL